QDAVDVQHSSGIAVIREQGGLPIEPGMEQPLAQLEVQAGGRDLLPQDHALELLPRRPAQEIPEEMKTVDDGRGIAAPIQKISTEQGLQDDAEFRSAAIRHGFAGIKDGL